jgi:hypothetical protein
MLCLVGRNGPPVPQLSLSEDFVLSTASAIRIELNKAMGVARDVALGKDFKLFLKVWIFSLNLTAVFVICIQEVMCCDSMLVKASLVHVFVVSCFRLHLELQNGGAVHAKLLFFCELEIGVLKFESYSINLLVILQVIALLWVVSTVTSWFNFLTCIWIGRFLNLACLWLFEEILNFNDMC